MGATTSAARHTTFPDAEPIQGCWLNNYYHKNLLIDNKPEGIIIVPQERGEDMTAVSVLERCAAGERRHFAEGVDNEAGELW